MLITNDQYRPLFTSLFICQCHTKSLEMGQRGACMFETPVTDSFMLPCDLICGHKHVDMIIIGSNPSGCLCPRKRNPCCIIYITMGKTWGHSDSDLWGPKCNEFIFEFGWTFAQNLKMYPEGVAEMMCSHKRSARKDRWMDRRRENITPPATAIAGADALTLHCVRLTGKPWMIFSY